MVTKITDESLFISVLYAIGENPLENWIYNIKNGHVKRLTDEDIQSPCLEILGAKIEENYIQSPKDNKKSLKIHLPIIILLIKNLEKYFEFSVTIVDDKKIERTFNASNFKTLTRVKGPFCSLQLKMEEGWNQLNIDLEEFCKKAFGTKYIETKSITLNANCRIKRIYFTKSPLNYSKIPPEYKVFAAIEEDEKNNKDSVKEEDGDI